MSAMFRKIGRRLACVPGLLVVVVAAGATVAAGQDTASRPFVSPIFGGNMVLQREKPNVLWGWSEPGDTVRVEVAGSSATGTAGADGKWQVKIQPPPVGGPYAVKITGRHQAGEPEYGNYITHWYDDYDLGGANWADPALDDSSWKTVTAPGGFYRDLGIEDVPGLFWLRKEITLPAKLPPGMARLYLGSVDKMDATYINGHQVGASSSGRKSAHVFCSRWVPQARSECDRDTAVQAERIPGITRKAGRTPPDSG
jgi:hypothetical protein